MNEAMFLSLWGTAVVGGLLLVLWIIHLRTGNAAIVDAGWAGGLAILRSEEHTSELQSH